MTMRFVHLGAATALFMLAAAPAAAQGASDKSEMFAREGLRICVDTAAEPAAVRSLAAAENWTAIDPALVPFKSSMVREAKKRRDDQRYHRAAAWLIEKQGLAATVGLFDIPGEPRMKQCELIAWDLDSAIVDRTILADTRLRGSSGGIGELRLYSGPGVRAMYLTSDTGSKVIHAFTVN